MSSGDDRPGLGFLDGGGRMGALMRAHDWSRSPLGDPAAWPDALKISVSTCLSSRFPMVIWWGPQLLMLYNDAWQPILGATKHPAGLGRPGAESWPETWPIVGVQFENALKGIASWSEDLLLPSDRKGFIEECYFTYSHGPLRDATGEIVGVCSVVSETTAHVLNERRLQILKDLSNATIDATSQPRSVDDLARSLLALLCARHADLPFAALYLTASRNHARQIASAGIDPAWLPSEWKPGDDDAWGIGKVLLSGERATIDHTPAMSATLPGGAWPEPTRQVVALPLASDPNRNRDPRGVLVVGINSRLRLDPPYEDFLERVAVELAAAVSALQLVDSERVARAEAERASQVKDEFLATLSHELRTPLQAILTWAQVLNNESLEIDKVRSASAAIERNARRQSRLVEDVLDISRIVSGTLVLASEPVDLSKALSAAADILQPTFQEKGVALELHVEDACEVMGDERRLEQVAWNLLSNAVKFTPAGRSVAAYCRRRGDQVELSVCDTGCGISPDFLPHVFDRFRQEDTRIARTHTGLGLGLAIVRHIIESHGGVVSAISEGRDRGATFTVRVPWAKGETVTPSRSASVLPKAIDLMGVRVLAIDDEPDGRESIAIMLRSSGAEVRTAGSVREALVAVGAWRPDVVVSDLAMPDADGIELARQLRAAGFGDIPLIALTAHAFEEEHGRVLAAGFVATASKPIGQGELLEVVCDAIGRSMD